jgi:predicted nuclease of predicted toxin-antitoxin system
MLRFAADENFNNNIVRGLLRRKPELDVLRIQDAGLYGADDPAVLEWAAKEDRVLLTNGLPMPGVFEVNYATPIGIIIEDILIVAECSLDGEWEGQVRYLPL